MAEIPVGARGDCHVSLGEEASPGESQVARRESGGVEPPTWAHLSLSVFSFFRSSGLRVDIRPTGCQRLAPGPGCEANDCSPSAPSAFF